MQLVNHIRTFQNTPSLDLIGAWMWVCGFKPIEPLKVYRVPFFGGGALSGRGAGVPPRCHPVEVAPSNVR